MTIRLKLKRGERSCVDSALIADAEPVLALNWIFQGGPQLDEKVSSTELRVGKDYFGDQIKGGVTVAGEDDIIVPYVFQLYFSSLQNYLNNLFYEIFFDAAATIENFVQTYISNLVTLIDTANINLNAIEAHSLIDYSVLYKQKSHRFLDDTQFIYNRISTLVGFRTVLFGDKTRACISTLGASAVVFGGISFQTIAKDSTRGGFSDGMKVSSLMGSTSNHLVDVTTGFVPDESSIRIPAAPALIYNKGLTAVVLTERGSAGDSTVMKIAPGFFIFQNFEVGGVLDDHTSFSSADRTNCFKACLVKRIRLIIPTQDMTDEIGTWEWYVDDNGYVRIKGSNTRAELIESPWSGYKWGRDYTREGNQPWKIFQYPL